MWAGALVRGSPWRTVSTMANMVAGQVIFFGRISCWCERASAAAHRGRACISGDARGRGVPLVLLYNWFFLQNCYTSLDNAPPRWSCASLRHIDNLLVCSDTMLVPRAQQRTAGPQEDWHGLSPGQW